MTLTTRTRVILVGGFLGAGKTTLLLAAAKRLTAAGLRVGLVTNDQGADLVDTSLAVQRHIPVTEVAGGCFCCRFPDLLIAFDRLRDQVQPDVILAEPVGSCTDLMATVLLPLVRYEGDRFTLARLTVLVDATRPASDPASPVAYLRRQQLAEAEILGLTKVDLLPADEAAALRDELAAAYPHARLISLAALHGTGLDAWLEQVMAQESSLARVLDIDYTAYAEAEASLAWLNAKAVLRGPGPFAADRFAEQLLQGIAARLAAEQAPIAHLKCQLVGSGIHLKGSITASGRPVYWDDWTPDAQVERAQLLINARVETGPPLLERTVRDALDAAAAPLRVRHELTHFECFQPAPPQPTHRLAV